jgi:hypothetical protein
MSELPRLAADLLDWCGTDPARCHEALDAELAGYRRDNVLAELRNRLPWPQHDVDPAVVLAACGTPGFPPLTLLRVEQSRPERWKRPALIAELEARVAAQGDNAGAVAPTNPAATFKQLFRDI